MTANVAARLHDLVCRLDALGTQGSPPLSPEQVQAVHVIGQELGVIHADVARYSRAVEARASCQHLIIHTSDPDKLVSEICRLLVDRAGYRAACWGIRSPDIRAGLQLTVQAGLDYDLGVIPSGPAGEDADTAPLTTALESGRPLVWHQEVGTRDRNAWLGKALGFHCESALILPVTDSSHSGALLICSDEGEAFDDAETALLEGLAADLAHALNALHQRTSDDPPGPAVRQSVDDLALLNAMNHASNRGATIDELLGILCQRARSLFGARGAAAYLVSEDGTSLVLKNVPIPPAMVSRVELMIGTRLPEVRIPLRKGSVYEGLLRSGMPQLITDQATIQRMMEECTESRLIRRFVPSIARLLGYRCVLSVPMVAEGATIGLVDIGRTAPFDTEEVQRFVIIAEQLTALLRHRQVLEALRSSEKRYRGLFDGLPVGLFRATVDGAMMEANPALAGMLGFSSPDELLTKSIMDLHLDPADPQRWLRETVDHGMLQGREVRLRRHQGSALWARVSCRVVADDKGNARWIEGVIEDITDSRVLVEHLHQASKMESIGRLAGGIAHGFNNLLQVILGYSDLMMSRASTDDPRRDEYLQIQQAGVRAQSLVRQLLALSGRQVMQPRVLDLNALIVGQQAILDPILGDRYQFVLDLGQALWPVNVDPHQVGQAIVNLVVNAKDAMPDGGRIELRTENVTVGKAESGAMPEAREGAFVCVSIKDSGVGMSPGMLRQVFEPFYTTKGHGTGGGMGLATAHGVVSQHGGWIGVQSTPGHGSEFTMYLPACSEASVVLPEVCQDDEEAPRGNGELILVVEDEVPVLAMTARVLREQGYQVSEAQGYRHALACFDAQASEISMLLSDVILPDGNGIDLADYLRGLKPQLKLLLVSGYIEDCARTDVLGHRGIRFLQKPYSLNSMLSAVYHALRDPVWSGGTD